MRLPAVVQGPSRPLDPESLGSHVARLYRAAYGLTGSRQDAEDLVQDTFERVLRRPRFIRRDEDLVYLLRVLRNAWISSRRGKREVAIAVVYMIVADVYPFLVRALPRSRFAPSELRLVYVDGRGLLREALAECARRGFSISDLEIKQETNGARNGRARHVRVDLEVRGPGSVTALASELTELDGVVSVYAGDANEFSY